MFLVKISTLAIAPIILSLSLLGKPKSVTTFLKSSSILIIVLIIMIVSEVMLTGINVRAIIDDYREVAAVRSSLASWDGFSRVLNSGTTILSALLLIIYARKPPPISHAKSINAIVTYIVVQLALNVSNTQPATIYVAPACAVVLLSWRAGLF